MDKNYIKNNNHNEFISTKEFNKSENQENNKIKNNEKMQKINKSILKEIGNYKNKGRFINAVSSGKNKNYKKEYRKSILQVKFQTKI